MCKVQMFFRQTKEGKRRSRRGGFCLTFETLILLIILNGGEIMGGGEYIELKKALNLYGFYGKLRPLKAYARHYLPYYETTKKIFNNLKFNVYEKPIKHIW